MQMKPPARPRFVVFYLVRLFLAGALLAGCISLAAAEQMVYEHYYYSTTTDRVAGITWKAQTFVPAVSHAARIVRLRMTKEGNPPGNMTVSPRATNASGAPTGGDLVSGNIACSSITAMNLWYDFDRGIDYALSAGTTCAFVMSAPSGDLSNMIWSHAAVSTSHDYAGGIYLYSITGDGISPRHGKIGVVK